ncbi:LapA family protein [Photobacterium sp. 1_MG-2023]|uniref:LapA family protein n=1 Tax=Photobacterium sp. 1_MG-2023 TaxID=3062646 RepID=UPI0026E37E49|nr:lipopolysaccharide assembly protein LapA domain-containing protein [Photobacterium sp. 1_MG-2023]MDO6706589.1 lipopolysaccharide assembly protein LapA domain-containing protein [Photobacterium sp. 1_MG-2023]
MKIVGILILIVCFLITLALGAQNQVMVDFDFLIAKGQFQLSTLLGVTFGTGFAIGWLICGSMYLKARLSKKSLTKRIAKQEKELEQLRSAETAKE